MLFGPPGDRWLQAGSRDYFFMEQLRTVIAVLRRGDGQSLTAFVARAASGTLIVKIATTVLGLLINVEIGRLLGAQGYGDYGVAIAIMSLALIVAKLGLDKVALRETAGAWALKDWARLRGVTRFVASATVAASVAISLVGVMCAFVFYAKRPDLRDAIIVAMVILPIVSLQGQIASSVLGLYAVVRAQIPDLLTQAGFAAALGLALLGGLSDLSGADVVVVQGTAAFGGLVIVMTLWRRLIPEEGRIAAPDYDSRSWLAAGIPFMLSGAASIINFNADIILLEHIKGPAAAGIYRAATRGAMFVPIAMLLIQPALSPVVASLHAAGDKARLQRAVTKASRLACLGGIAVTVPLILAGDRFLHLFGPEFVSGHFALTLLSLAQLICTSAAATGILVSMAGAERDLAIGSLLAVILNLALIVILIPQYGMNGAAAATATSTILSTLYLVFLAQRRLGVDPSIFGLAVFGKKQRQ